MRNQNAVPSKRKTRLTKFLLVVIWIMIFAVLAGMAWLFWENSKPYGQESENPAAITLNENVLVCVSDDTYDTPPAFYLLNFNSQNKQISSAVLPNDLKCTVGSKTDTLQNHYNYGGIKQIQSAVENLCGIKTDYYMEIDCELLQNVLDTMGSFEYNVAEDMSLKSKSGTVICDIKKGKQSFTGPMLAEFYRYTDWDENERAKQLNSITCEMINKFSTAEKSKKISQLFADTAAELKTDLSVMQIEELQSQFDCFTKAKNAANSVDVVSAKGSLDDNSLSTLKSTFK